jgi:hypothetical protein
MASFSTTPPTVQPATPALKLDGTTTTAPTVSLSVSQMADVLKQFNANGQPLGAASTLTAGEQTLKLDALQNSHNSGFLVAKR